MSKGFFEAFLQMDGIIKLKMAELDSLKNTLQGIRYDTDKVMTSPKDPMPELVVKILEKEKEINDLIDSRYRAKLKIREMIDSIPNENWADALSAKYLEGMSAEEYAREKGLKIPTFWKYIRKGLEVLSEKC